MITGTNGTTSVVALGGVLGTIAVDSLNNKAFIAKPSESSIAVLDGAVYKQRPVLSTPAPNHVGVNPWTNRVYAFSVAYVTGIGTLAVLNPESGQASALTPVGGYVGLAIDLASNKVYIPTSSGLSGTLTVVDGSNNSILNVPTGPDSRDAAVNPISGRYYVTAEGAQHEHFLFILEGGTNHVLAKVKVDRYPVSPLVNPKTNRFFFLTSKDLQSWMAL